MLSLDMIEAIVKFELIYPYKKSVGTIFDLSSIWNLKILKASTRSDEAFLIIPWRQFKKMFNKNPMKGELEVPSLLKKCVLTIEVLEVIVNEDQTV